MSKPYKTLIVDGVEVHYQEYKGVGNNRYELACNIKGKWIQFRLICPPGKLEYKVKEFVNVQNRL